MRISVEHTTVYRYDTPVWPEPHTIRLRPRTDAAQRLIRHEIAILPQPAGQSWCLDQDGNVVLETWFVDQIAELQVRSAFEVETTRENPFDYLPRGQEALPEGLAPYLGASQDPAVLELVHRIGDREPQAFAGELNRILWAEFDHIVRDEGAPETPARTLELRNGSCRDLAVLFCAAARTRGLPARFISGYEQEASMHETAYMHAWAEVYLAGGGWRGYDPSQGLAVAMSHVAVAAAADPLLAAPMSGTYRGAARSKMDFQIAMQVQS